MREQQIHAPIVHVVAQSHSHVGLFESIFVRSYTRNKRDILEFALAVALVEIVRLPVVSNEKIKLPVVVKIRPDRGQTIATFRIVHSSLFRYVGESPVAIVVIEVVGRSFQSARTTLHIDPKILARLARTEYWQVVQAKIDIVRYKKVGPTIA